ncbi:hypothetical protein AVEN_214748-1 [Araneus ventricosus]|uniref:Uncharacterized protein n=1 Tax=Araneus ventricosus TaxID=182803 RepID=A0A4Y2UWQ0_ARAVE|nr:hypothetical protein AVEN_214748-1 [Araneus ventricosus]
MTPYEPGSLPEGRSGLVVRFRLRVRRFPSSNPYSRRICGTENPPYISEPVATQIRFRGSNVLSPLWCGSLERGCQLRCRPRHLIAVQNYEVRLKIVVVLHQNRKLL